MIEEKLYRKQENMLRKLRGVRKPLVEDIFKRVAYLGPEDFKVAGYKRTKPVAVFNPGALLHNDRLLLFPRMIFDYYKYVSSIGFVEIKIDDLLDNSLETPIEARILVWPRRLWEFLGSEDPRAFYNKGSYYLLYTGKGFYLDDRNYYRRDVLAFVEYDSSWKLLRKGYFTISEGNETFIPQSNKDSAFIKIEGDKAVLLTRPEIRGKHVCWRCVARLSDLTIDSETLEPILVYEEWELKVGWSTNTVKLSSNEYLVGWHGVILTDYAYRDGFAIVSEEGELLAVSNYLLSPQGLTEEYGDRSLVIFGDGLVKYKELLIWVGGVSDYAIGFFVAELDKVLEKMRWVRGHVT
ncbi:MAG: hypothetical protein J7L38_07455 [Thermoproteales archaeon]|nr:hypothetical protein [Thermoproteales archaeon]